MNLSRLEDRVCEDEGYRPAPYLCTAGVWTIGYGTTRILGKPVTEQTPLLNEEVARQFLRADLWEAAKGAATLVSNWASLTDGRREVLVNMVYNLGLAGAERFVYMLNSIELGDWSAAANHMLDSKWARQVGARATRLAKMMNSG